MRIRNWVITVVVASSLSLAAADQPGTLTLEDRVQAQAAIERVYYRHQTGTTRPFEEAVSRALLERKVRTYLDQTVALESHWSKPVTPEMLQAEIDRMTRESRMPDRLRELFGALQDDPFLIAECLARPALVSRLANRYFSNDDRIHGPIRREIERVRTDLLEGKLDLQDTEGDWRVVEYVTTEEADRGPNDGIGVARAVVTREELAQRKEAVTDGIGRVTENRTGFSLLVSTAEDPDGLRLATYTLPKTDWQSWWEATTRLWDTREEVAPQSRGTDFVLPPVVTGTPCEDEGWVGSMYVPEARELHVAVWTGSRMLIWGGRCFQSDLGNGARYDPATDTWEQMSTDNEPEGRSYATAVWTGTEMLVWGGIAIGDIPNVYYGTGGRYDPATDSWTAITTVDAPVARSWHTAVWTGSEMIVWGGAGINGAFPDWHYKTGARYDPDTDTWTPVPTVQAPAPRRDHTAVWSGTEMIVWGGYVFGETPLDSGGKFDPTTNSWTPTTVHSPNLPTGRKAHEAVWTGGEMIVWGGADSSGFPSTGGLYDPITDSWGSIDDGGPATWEIHQAIWTGTDMIIGNVPGATYNLETDSWSNLPDENSPYPILGATAVWTGTEMIVWGGDFTVCHNTGARFNPVSHSWTPIDPSTITPRDEHTALWTGAKMIVWGGDVFVGDADGGQYDPSTNTWTPVSLIGASEAGPGHSAVWTGDLALYFGGFGTPQIGRYDPFADTWEPMSPSAGISHRWNHTAVWTGSDMIIWGGTLNGNELNDGSSYNVASDSWTTTSIPDAPGPRHLHTAVWTGSRMLVWGGYLVITPYGDGGSYNPATDTWSPINLLGAPAARGRHTAVWTGSEMIVWGGLPGSPISGGRYETGDGTWQATSFVGAPVGRYRHTAVWTGEEMIVWGGTASLDPGRTGGRYNPQGDLWTATPTLNAPAPRVNHTAVWTGDRMIVWGGATDEQPNSSLHESGAALAFELSIDNDGDGYSDCDGDCNDLDPEVFPFQTEVCDGFDNDCDLVIDEDSTPEEIGNLVFLNQASFRWDPGATGLGGIHDVVRGVISGLPVGSEAAEICFRSTTNFATFDIQRPPSGAGYWYLVRARNDCGAGTYGSDSDAAERMTSACP